MLLMQPSAALVLLLSSALLSLVHRTKTERTETASAAAEEVELAAADDDDSNSVVICRSCGHDLFQPRHIFTLSSPGSIRSSNVTLIGSVRSHLQLLRNPHGYEFEVVTVRRSVCQQQGEWHSSHSWFPGYFWKICVCPKCGAHIGWIFKEEKELDKPSTAKNSFYGLIFEKILEESTISQLISAPRSYRL